MPRYLFHKKCHHARHQRSWTTVCVLTLFQASSFFLLGGPGQSFVCRAVFKWITHSFVNLAVNGCPTHRGNLSGVSFSPPSSPSSPSDILTHAERLMSFFYCELFDELEQCFFCWSKSNMTNVPDSAPVASVSGRSSSPRRMLTVLLSASKTRAARTCVCEAKRPAMMTICILDAPPWEGAVMNARADLSAKCQGCVFEP